MTTQEFTVKYDSENKFKEDELKEIVFSDFDDYENCDEIEIIEGEDRRWSRTNTTIININGRYFSINWEEGLTEMQPNEFYNQPIEVIPNVYEKLVTITEWKKVLL